MEVSSPDAAAASSSNDAAAASSSPDAARARTVLVVAVPLPPEHSAHLKSAHKEADAIARACEARWVL